MISKKVVIKNPAGLYLNFAGAVCKTAMDYKCSIKLISKEAVINAKSILNVLGANIKYNDEIELVCEGNDEELAIEAIYSVLQKEII